MRPSHFFRTAATALLGLGLTVTPAAAQTYTDCNPLHSRSCPSDRALGKSVSATFGSKPSSDFAVTGTGSISFSPQSGASLTVAKPGDSPILASEWYIMFGRVDVSVKTAPGAGLVSSVVLISDTLDEIDWEWLGGQPGTVQSNFFGKGVLDHTNAATHPNPNHGNDFHTYSIDWTHERIEWLLDGAVVRTVTAAQAGDKYPQSPMKVKLGPWAGGDPSTNSEGTVNWAGGPTDFSKGPFVMQVKSASVADYSTGSAYVYTDTSGTWGSIKAVDGRVNGKNGKADSTYPVSSTPPPVGQPVAQNGGMIGNGHGRAPGNGNGNGDAANGSKTGTGTGPRVTTYPGLPAGWTVDPSGKVRPPSSGASAAGTADQTSSSSSSPSSSSSSKHPSAPAGPIGTNSKPDDTNTIDPPNRTPKSKSSSPTPTKGPASVSAVPDTSDFTPSPITFTTAPAGSGVSSRLVGGSGTGSPTGPSLFPTSSAPSSSDADTDEADVKPSHSALPEGAAAQVRGTAGVGLGLGAAAVVAFVAAFL